MMRLTLCVLGSMLVCMAGQVHAGVIFEDDFNRPDGPVGNGWIDSPDNEGGNLGIINEQLSVPQHNTDAGIHRPLPFSDPVRIQATIWETDGFDLVGSRFESVFVVANDGTLPARDGYGISVLRTEADTDNSQVLLFDNGRVEPRVPIFSPWQFDSVLDVDFWIFPDGRMEGSITEGNNVFDFAFGPREIQSNGANFGFYHGWNAGGSVMPPRMDNLIITPEPTALALLLIGGIVAIKRRR